MSSTPSAAEPLPTPPRCSARSLAAGEPLAGTASTVGAFLLLEAPGPWGVEARRDSRLPAEVKDRLLLLEREQGVRPLLIRRPGRPVVRSVHLFAAYTRGEQPWLEEATLADPRELLDLPLEGLGRGRSPGLVSRSAPVFLVCTHGRHDACCAELGRPLAAALAQAAPEETWEVSHVGGDRFAGNVVVLPHGLYYGRLQPADVARFAALHLSGHLDLDHLRGRSAYPLPAQVADVHLRRHLAATALGAVRLTAVAREGAESVAAFAVGAERWEVRVRSTPGEPRPLTCRAARPSRPPTHDVVSLGRADPT